MIAQSLVGEQVDLKRVHFVHFKPANLNAWFKKVPRSAVYFLLLLSSDELKKVSEMRSQGLKVVVLKTKAKNDYKGFDIRSKILEEKTWQDLVPKAVERILEKMDLLSRLKIK